MRCVVFGAVSFRRMHCEGKGVDKIDFDEANKVRPRKPLSRFYAVGAPSPGAQHVNLPMKS